MRFRPFWLVLVLAAYLPLEEFILKWLPVSDSALLMLHQVPDMLLGAVALLVLGDRLVRFRGLRGFGLVFDWMIGLFLVSATVSLLLNPGASIVQWLASLKALLRYLLLAYIVNSYSVSRRDRKRLVSVLVAGVWIQIVLGLTQFAGGLPMRDFLGARSSTAQIGGFGLADFTGTRFEGVNDLMGTMGNTIDYGAFLVVGITIFLCCVPPERRFQRSAGVMLSFFCVYLTNSRSALIAAFVIVFCYLYFRSGKRRALLFAVSTTTCIALIAIVLASGKALTNSDDYQSRTRFFSMFSNDYVQAAMGQRLGMVVYLAPDFLSDPAGVPFGYTPDSEVVVAKARSRFPNVPDALLLVLPGIIEDVYWLAIMIQYGLIGLTLFLSAFVWAIRTLLKRFHSETDTETRNFILSALLLMLVSIPMNCFNQVLLLRQFTLCQWIFFAMAILPTMNCSSNSPRRGPKAYLLSNLSQFEKSEIRT